MENLEKEFVDPKIKKEINEDGFEGSAAVFIGKKEEIPQLMERLEKEGMADDLGTYIRMHKEIKLPKEEIPPEFLNTLINNKGSLWYVSEKMGGEKYKYLPESIIYNYVDNDGNIASFNLDTIKLTPTRKIIENKTEKQGNEMYMTIKNLLEESGFSIMKQIDDAKFIGDINEQILNYQKRLEEEAEKKKKEEFDF